MGAKKIVVSKVKPSLDLEIEGETFTLICKAEKFNTRFILDIKQEIGEIGARLGQSLSSIFGEDAEKAQETLAIGTYTDLHAMLDGVDCFFTLENEEQLGGLSFRDWMEENLSRDSVQDVFQFVTECISEKKKVT